MSDPRLPSPDLIADRAIEPHAFATVDESWFEYPVRANPHHTDYGGIVWHGSYLTWMEEARVECLRSIGVEFSDLVAMGCDLPVVEVGMRYHRSLLMGEMAIVQTRINEIEGVRIHWDYRIQSPPAVADAVPITYVTARVTLVAVDRDRGKILRRLPPNVEDALTKIARLHRRP